MGTKKTPEVEQAVQAAVTRVVPEALRSLGKALLAKDRVRSASVLDMLVLFEAPRDTELKEIVLQSGSEELFDVLEKMNRKTLILTEPLENGTIEKNWKVVRVNNQPVKEFADVHEQKKKGGRVRFVFEIDGDIASMLETLQKQESVGSVSAALISR